MIRTLIADTDKTNCKNYKNYIEEYYPEFEVIGDVSSSKEIYSILQTKNIDLIICDMQLEDITAYQLFINLNNNFPDVKMIFCLSFSEIEYGKKAVADGLISYILKPVKPNTLEKALIETLDTMEEIQKQKQAHNLLMSQYNEHLPVFEDRFLINLIHGHIENEGEILRTFRYFNMNIKPKFTVCIIKIDNYKTISLTLDEREKQIFIFSILDCIKKYLKENGKGIAFINHFNSITVILGSCEELPHTIDICNEIKEKINKEENTSVTIGVGKSYSNASEISISYKQAKAALRYDYRMGIGSVIPIEYVEPENHITYRFPLKKEELLVYTIVVGDYEKSVKLLDEIFEALKKCGKLPEKLLPKIVLDILVSVNRYASEQNLSVNESFSKIFSVNLISQKDTIEEAYEYLKSSIKVLCENIDKSRKENDNKLFESGQKYTDTYFFMPISLNKAAQYANTTPEYLNELFLKKTGKTFYEYSVLVRIEKAKYFILETDLSDKDIAKKVGYDDAHHFARVFFTYEHQSLESFRKKNK